jgi:hypothetical protein
VRQELAALRLHDQHRRDLARAVANAKRAFRRSKTALAPILAELGYHYHGDTLRKFRVGMKPTSPAPPGDFDHG